MLQISAAKPGPNVAAIKAAELIEDQTGKKVAGFKNGLNNLCGSIITDVAAQSLHWQTVPTIPTCRQKLAIVQVP